MSEGAHPGLGQAALGPAGPEDVLCLCPNHHALLDHGGIYIGDDVKARDYTGASS